MDQLKNEIIEHQKQLRFYYKEIYNLEALIKQKEKKICELCDHEWITRREPIPYGEMETFCVKCNLIK